MDVILIPGLWLDGSTWSEVAPRLEAAGHTVHALTPPGLDGTADPAVVTLAQTLGAVTDLIDAVEGRALVVGHSAAAGLAWAAADARPDGVHAAVLVGGFPATSGDPLMGADLPVVDGTVPFPGWEPFEGPDTADMDDEVKAAVEAGMRPAPLCWFREPVELRDERRLDVPLVMVCPEFRVSDVQEWIDAGEAPAELTAAHHVSYVDLPTGHWPQVTRPAELADAILEAAGTPRA